MKYIIEIPDDVPFVLLRKKARGEFITKVVPVAELEELNSDYINENFGELQDEAYQRGLEDAWEAARKIVVNPDNGGIASETLLEIFGMRGYTYIMQENTAQEAIDKIKAYEDKQKEKSSIKVGDEVKHHFQGYGVVTRIKEVNGKTHYNAVWSNGNTGYYRFDDLKKTGKHYDIASILEAMRE